jgi:2-polyprenyl-3-methyl-5-hydroxy-6-metoxy-1,4-benzoquinol methylase
MEVYPCTYCKSTDNTQLYPTNDVFGHHYHINCCNDCNAYFLTKPPDSERLAQAYDDSYYGEGDDKFDGTIEKVLDYFRRKRAKKVHRFVKGKGKVLDVGCGNGRFLQFLGDMGDYNLNGVEMEGGSADRAAKVPGLQLKKGTLLPGDFDVESLDAITMFHVFEHLTEPAETLKTMTSILKKGGMLMISFPNIDSWQAKRFKGNWLHLDPPRHISFYSPKRFKEIVNELGYEVVREKHFSTEYNPFGYQQSLLNNWLGKREVLYEHLKGNKDYVREYSKFNLVMQKAFYMGTFPFFICADLIASAFSKSATVEFILRKN